MGNFSYRTIEKAAEGQYKDKGSRFLAFAWPVNSEDDIKAHLEKIRKKYFDARHHCFAWVLGADRKSFRAFDDGEPNHSAGDPILGQIRSKELTNVLIVVVRYFGGVKLGVGGLISAYKQAAADALANAVAIEKDVTINIIVYYDYPCTGEVMRLIRDFDLVINEQSFDDTCVLKAVCKIKDQQMLLEKLTLMKTLGQIRDFTNS
jgi:uncharacterized YigZ family protein